MLREHVVGRSHRLRWLEVRFPEPAELRSEDREQVCDLVRRAVRRASSTPSLTVVWPEVRAAPEQWPAHQFFDGAPVALDSVGPIVTSMVADRDFWCLLESPTLAFHPFEEVLWIGLTDGLDDLLSDAVPWIVREIDDSPFVEDIEKSCDLPPADALFWNRVEALAAEPNRCVVEVQWAGGSCGSWWFVPRGPGDVAEIRGQCPPRSVLACYGASRLIDPTETARLGELARQDGSHFDDINPVVVLNGLTVRREGIVVGDFGEFRAAIERPDSHLVVATPGTASLNHSDILEAAIPDSDGVIRAPLAFDRA